METWSKTTKETTLWPRGQVECMELVVLIADNGNMEEHNKGDDLVAEGPGRGHGAASTNRT